MYRQKGKAVQHQDSLWAKAIFMFGHFKTEYGRSISVKSWNSPVVNRVQLSSVSQSSIGSSKNPWKWLILLLLQVKGLSPVVLTFDSAICWINNYPADNYYGNQLRSPMNRFLSGWQRYPTLEQSGLWSLSFASRRCQPSGNRCSRLRR